MKKGKFKWLEGSVDSYISKLTEILILLKEEAVF